MAPFSEADAAKRVFNAARRSRRRASRCSTRSTGSPTRCASIVTSPMVKGDMSTELHARLPDPYQRYCQVCEAEHLYEQPFRFAALRGGLELQAGHLATGAGAHPRLARPGPARSTPPCDAVRAALRLLGPATPEAGRVLHRRARQGREGELARRRRDGDRRGRAATAPRPPMWHALLSPPDTAGLVRLLGPFDLFLQARDRELVVPDEAHRKDLWRTLGRPGGVLVGQEVLGSWRPRASGKKLRVAVNAWAPLPDLTEQAERLAAFRGVTFDGFVDGLSGRLAAALGQAYGAGDARGRRRRRR